MKNKHPLLQLAHNIELLYNSLKRLLIIAVVIGICFIGYKVYTFSPVESVKNVSLDAVDSLSNVGDTVAAKKDDLIEVVGDNIPDTEKLKTKFKSVLNWGEDE